MENIIESQKGSGINMEQCIRDCIACYEECTSCLSHCLSLGGKHTEARHITLMMECAELCRTSASIMHLKGEFAFELCQVCADVCDACAESCSNIDPDDETMLKCADVCRKCATSCRNMSH